MRSIEENRRTTAACVLVAAAGCTVPKLPARQVAEAHLTPLLLILH